jgi:RHS repeat-associated protein
MKTYGYDDLDRLTSAGMSVNSVPTYERDFTYDQYGCIHQVDENSVTISSYSYNVTPFHAPVYYNGNDLNYDDNGNLIEDEDFIYVYSDANQLSEVRYSGNNSLVEKYWYDANGKRIKKQNADGQFSYYVNKFYEVDKGTATSYFFRDDERIAKQTAGDMEWYLSDHLGSTTLLVNESGLEVERTEYFPYGQVQSGGLEKYGFTGQENDADTELMYYGARYYSPEYRVFVQPDSMLPDPYNPQALNRYAYVLNNPVKYTDPSGNFVQLIVAGVKVVSTVIDYGWNVYDFATDSWTIINPNSNEIDKEVAVRCLALNIVSESLDPDELLPVNTPADDIARKAIKKEIRQQVTEEFIEKEYKDVAEYITKNGKLPDNYITKEEARNLGWVNTEGNLAEVAPGKSIGGNVYRNDNGALPDAPGRTWYEADIGYQEGYRDSYRLLYSNDGLIYKSNHYKTVEKIK